MLKSMLNQHWFCIVPLLPALAMIAVHEAFGLSDEMMGHQVGRPRATTAELCFNFTMVLAFYSGIAGFLAHSLSLARVSTTWLLVKLSVLAVGWYLLLSWAAAVKTVEVGGKSAPNPVKDMRTIFDDDQEFADTMYCVSSTPLRNGWGRMPRCRIATEQRDDVVNPSERVDVAEPVAKRQRPRMSGIFDSDRFSPCQFAHCEGRPGGACPIP